MSAALLLSLTFAAEPPQAELYAAKVAHDAVKRSRGRARRRAMT